MKQKKSIIIAIAVITMVISVMFSGCEQADHVNYNLSREANKFNIERRITVYNARTDYVVMYIEGYMSINNNSEDELIVTCQTDTETYKKNYVYLNDNVIYTVEDITGTHTDPYHYKFVYHSDWMPEIEVEP